MHGAGDTTYPGQGRLWPSMAAPRDDPSGPSEHAAGIDSGGPPQDIAIRAAEHIALGATEHHIPIVEVAFRSGTWWSIPAELSRQLYEKYISGQDAGYTWDWGGLAVDAVLAALKIMRHVPRASCRSRRPPRC